jgi:hypothetical protein
MAETLGSLCDKLTIVKLKQWHSEDSAKLRSLDLQEKQLREEIDQFVEAATTGGIPVDRLTFAANKVYKPQTTPTKPVSGTLGEVFSQLAAINCALWHEQEKVYEFEAVPPDEKNGVVKQLAVLNLERNECIDRIDRILRDTVESGAHAS